MMSSITLLGMTTSVLVWAPNSCMNTWLQSNALATIRYYSLSQRTDSARVNLFLQRRLNCGEPFNSVLR